MIQEFYKDQTLFLTGISGFVGRIFLEKVLYSLPNIRKAYVLIREKEGRSAQDRLNEDVLQRPCYDRVKKKYPDFNQLVQDKLVAISGDITLENLGMSNDNYQMVLQDTNIIFSMAASTSYSEPLDIALQNNTLSILRILDLGKACGNLKSFVHASTIFILTYLTGQIDEEIIEISDNPEKLFNQLLNTPQDQIRNQQQKILGRWPDTYLYCKILTENLLQKRCGDIPVIIARLPSVGASWREPFPGWVDSSTSGTTYLLNVGLGNISQGVFQQVSGDWYPADLCCNTMLAAACIYSTKPGVTILNVTASDRNPITMQLPIEVSVEYWNRFNNKKFTGPYRFKIFQTLQELKQRSFFTRSLPKLYYEKVGKLFRSKKYQEKFQRLTKMQVREENIAKAFHLNTTIHKKFTTYNIQNMLRQMTKQDKREFEINCVNIHWIQYLMLYTYGVHKWIIKDEDVDIPVDLSGHDLNWYFNQHSLLDRIKDKLQSGYMIQPISKKEIIEQMLGPSNVGSYITTYVQEAAARGQEFWKVQEEMYRELRRVADLMINNSFIFNLRTNGIALSQIFSKIFNRFVVDQNRLTKIKKYLEAQNGPVVIVTPYRSKLDFLIMQYVFYKLSIQQPYVVTLESQFNYSVVGKMLKTAGTIFVDKPGAHDGLYDAILKEYLQILMQHHQIIQIFIESEKNLTGLLSHPDQKLIKFCTDLYYRGLVPNMVFLPVSIVYDKLLEEDTIYQLKRDKATFFKDMQQMYQNCGNLHVHVGQKVEISRLISTPNSIPEHEIIDNQISSRLVQNIRACQAITPMSIISAVILCNKSGISLDSMVSIVTWLRDWMKMKNFNLGELYECNIKKIVKSNIDLYDKVFFLLDEDEDQSIEINQSNPESLKILNYFRAQLLHIFCLESIFACIVLITGGEQFWTTGIPLKKVEEKFHFLAQHFSDFFLYQRSVFQEERFNNVVQDLMDRYLIDIQGDRVIGLSRQGSNLHLIYSFLAPYIDIMWTSLFYAQQLRVMEAQTLNNAAKHIFRLMQSFAQQKMIINNEIITIPNCKHCIVSLAISGVLNLTDNMVSVNENYLQDEQNLFNLLQHIEEFKYFPLGQTQRSIEDYKRLLIREIPVVPKLQQLFQMGDCDCLFKCLCCCLEEDCGNCECSDTCGCLGDCFSGCKNCFESDGCLNSISSSCWTFTQDKICDNFLCQPVKAIGSCLTNWLGADITRFCNCCNNTFDSTCDWFYAICRPIGYCMCWCFLEAEDMDQNKERNKRSKKSKRKNVFVIGNKKEKRKSKRYIQEAEIPYGQVVNQNDLQQINQAIEQLPSEFVSQVLQQAELQEYPDSNTKDMIEDVSEGIQY